MGGLFTYTCTPGNGVAPVLSADTGLNPSAGVNRMIGGATATFIPYALAMPAIAAFTGGTQTAQITATIPAQGTLPLVDTYTDSVVLTLTY
jgi:spore coat protein U-like protein